MWVVLSTRFGETEASTFSTLDEALYWLECHKLYLDDKEANWVDDPNAFVSRNVDGQRVIRVCDLLAAPEVRRPGAPKQRRTKKAE